MESAVANVLLACGYQLIPSCWQILESDDQLALVGICSDITPEEYNLLRGIVGAIVDYVNGVLISPGSVCAGAVVPFNRRKGEAVTPFLQLQVNGYFLSSGEEPLVARFVKEESDEPDLLAPVQNILTLLTLTGQVYTCDVRTCTFRVCRPGRMVKVFRYRGRLYCVGRNNLRWLNKQRMPSPGSMFPDVPTCRDIYHFLVTEEESDFILIRIEQMTYSAALPPGLMDASSINERGLSFAQVNKKLQVCPYLPSRYGPRRNDYRFARCTDVYITVPESASTFVTLKLCAPASHWRCIGNHPSYNVVDAFTRALDNLSNNPAVVLPLLEFPPLATSACYDLLDDFCHPPLIPLVDFWKASTYLPTDAPALSRTLWLNFYACSSRKNRRRIRNLHSIYSACLCSVSNYFVCVILALLNQDYAETDILHFRDIVRERATDQYLSTCEEPVTVCPGDRAKIIAYLPEIDIGLTAVPDYLPVLVEAVNKYTGLAALRREMSNMLTAGYNHALYQWSTQLQLC